MPKKKQYLDKCKFVVHGLIKESVAICYNAKYFKLKKRKSHVGQPERCYNSVISLDSISTILNQITTRSGKFWPSWASLMSATSVTLNPIVVVDGSGINPLPNTSQYPTIGRKSNLNPTPVKTLWTFHPAIILVQKPGKKPHRATYRWEGKKLFFRMGSASYWGGM